MKVLFAVSNEEISESIVKRYQKEYKEIISYKNVYYFNAILKELQKDKNYDRIVISEELEAFTNSQYTQIDKFIFDKLDSISDEASNSKGDDIPIILICSDRREKSEEMLVKIFGIGIYSGLLGNDRSVNNVCNLLNKPRTKKEAKIYYKIDSDDVSYQSESENDVSEVEIQNILAHYKRLGKDERRYVESFDNIASQYNDVQLRIISKFLPLNVRAILEEQSPKYQQVISFNSKVSDNLRESNIKKETKNGTSEKLLNTNNKEKILSKPVVIPSSVNMNSTKKLAKVKNEFKPIETPLEEKVRTDIRKIGPAFKEKNIEETDDLDKILEQIETPVSNLQKEKNAIKETPVIEMLEEETKRGRGRPRKNPIPIQNDTNTPKRGRGRPRKNYNSENQEKITLQNVHSEEETILPGFQKIEEEPKETILPGFEKEKEETILPGFEEEQEETILPGFEEEQEEAILPGFEEEQEEAILPGFEEEQEETILPGFEEEQEETILPGFEEVQEETVLPRFEEDKEKSIMPKFEEQEKKQKVLTELEDIDIDDFEDIELTDNKEEKEYIKREISSEIEKQKINELPKTNITYDDVDISNLLTSNKKVACFIGTSKNGTSFIVNNLAEITSQMGIDTAILDTTKNRNSYYIYNRNEENLRKIAMESINNLLQGVARGIQVNKNLTVYTSLPDETEGIENAGTILQTLLQKHSLVLIDCDFETPISYFEKTQEIYLVQSFDILTMQPLTAFLRELKSKDILKENKLRIVLNKAVELKRVKEKTIIDGMSMYNDPAMSFMTELFNKNTIRYITIPFNQEVYTKYLESVINCEVSIKGYPKNIIQILNKLANMVYPLVSGRGAYTPPKIEKNGFTPSINSTLDRMKNKY